MKLNLEQRRIVELEPNGHMMVKGVAGSGKTTVAIRRVSFLQQHYAHQDDDRILFVTYNKTLLNYIKYQYNKIDDEEMLQIDALMGSKNKVDIVTIDSIMYKYYLDHLKRTDTQRKIASFKEELNALNRAIHIVQDKYPNVKLMSPKNSSFLKDEIAWIAACNITDEDSYQVIDRIGRAGDGIRSKLNKNSEMRSAIFELMRTYAYILEKEEIIDFKEMNLLALKEAQYYPKTKYTHILIDESQDLTRVQLEFIRCIYMEKKYSSILFVADNTQSIYSHSWLGKGRPFTSIGYDMSGKSRVLTKNYRTTTQISEAAYGLIEHDDHIKNNVDFVKPSLIDRQGHPPIYRYHKDSQGQTQFIINEIKQLSNDYKLSDICIVAKLRQSIENLCDALESSGIHSEILQQTEFNFESDKVKLITMHSIKGLEFKVIFLVDLNEGILPQISKYDNEDHIPLDSDDRKLLYVGMTRANELLYMSSANKPSKFIKEINNDCLRIRRDCSLRPFRSIGIAEYQFTSNILDVNSREEIVRQWFIKEIMKSYGYPAELIELEYPVHQFSRKGFVDIAIQIYYKDEKVPYIFVECKRFGSGIQDGIEQVRSYLEANKFVRYAVVTDGVDVYIEERDGDNLTDFPKFIPQFLPDRNLRKKYCNFKNGKTYEYTLDFESEELIDIRDSDRSISIEYSEYIQVPVLGKIIAGVPQVAQQEYIKTLSLPKEWLIDYNNSFSLEVTGDSMTGANIEKGDYVVVNYQDHVTNNDIVVAVIDNDATLKKYMAMGDSVLLVSENPLYEPIQMKKEDVIINGRVIGVLK